MTGAIPSVHYHGYQVLAGAAQLENIPLLEMQGSRKDINQREILP